MDYRAAAAAAYLGLGATWAMGLSSSAAQLQANPASLPPALLRDDRRDPVHRDDLPVAVDRWSLVLLVISVAIAFWSAPGPNSAVTAEAMGIDVSLNDQA